MLARFRQQDFTGAATSIARCREVDDGFGLEALFDLYATRIHMFDKIPRLPTGMAFSFLRPNSRPDNRTTRSSALTGELLRENSPSFVCLLPADGVPRIF